MTWIANAEVWPIDAKAGAVPQSWPGWPDGKRFGFILTHDVESNQGLSRVERLMTLELKHGFRSSFNLGLESQPPDALRRTLDEGGFEIGVRANDRKLFSSKGRFASQAARIREHLTCWNACGFRSSFMWLNSGWLHQLGIEYDASTFDTDPFEPQLACVGTIFPFWVPGPNGSGYVELPSTLCQDLSLFVMLRKRNIDIWKRKLDWIADRGGMVLLNTHPDHMCFGDRKPGRDEYASSYYEELLCYVREKYEGAFWSAPPREVARFYCAHVPLGSRNTRKKICMLAYSGYESDNRVRRYAEALARRGDQVEVVAYTSRDQLGVRDFNGVKLYRIQRRKRNERRVWTYALRQLRFLLASSIFLTRRHRQIRYDLIHVHNPPDFLAFAAWYPKWTGAKLILDFHDVMPEFFASKFKSKADVFLVKLLRIIERAAVTFVDHVIVSNHLWQEKLIGRSVRKEKCSVFLNHVDLALFWRHPRTRDDEKFIILFPGSFQWHQGLDIAIEAFARIKDQVPNAEFHIYGGTAGLQTLGQLADRLGVGERVKFCGGVPLDRMAEVIANADLGVVPKRADEFGNEAYSTKIMEFMSQGVPVVVSRTKIDAFYFDPSVVRFFESGNVQALADAMLDVIINKSLREALVIEGYKYVERHGWEGKKAEYLELVDSLSTEVYGNDTDAIED